MEQIATIDLNTAWHPPESTILALLRKELGHINISILGVDRALFSGRYTVRIENRGLTDTALRKELIAALDRLGYTADITELTKGAASGSPGGLAGVLQETKTLAFEGADVLKAPLSAMATVAVAAAIVVVVVYALPKLDR